MTVKKLNNGQFEVRHKNLTLIQTVIKGQRINDLSEDKDGINILCPESDDRFKELFIALHNFKQTL